MRYTKIVKTWSKLFTKEVVLALLIVVLAFFLRVNRYWEFPIGGETQDESAWAFLGSSLIQTGRPVSWSYFAAYDPDFIFLKRDNGAPLVSPVLDHPPLFSLLPGLAHTLKGSWENFPSLKVTRLPMVVLGTINVALLMMVAQNFFTRKRWVLMAGLILAVAPSFVLTSRLVVAENLVATWTLLALWLLPKTKWKWQFLLLSLIGCLAVLSKVSGLVVPATIFLYGLSIKESKVWRAGLVGGIFGVLAFVLFGAFYNFSLFLDILSSQAGRDLGWSTLQNRFFLHASIVEKFFFDGWIFVGLFTVPLILLKKESKYLGLNLFIIINLFFILLTSGEQTFHGWYDYVLYPLFALSITIVLAEIFEQRNWLLFSLVWLMLLPIFRTAAIHGGWYSDVSSLTIRFVASLGFWPFFFTQLKFLPIKKWHWLACLLIGVMIAASIYTVVVFNQVSYWEEHQFFSSW